MTKAAGARRRPGKQPSDCHPSAPHPFDFFDRLVWLDGRPLMSTIEPYRQKILAGALFTFDPDGRPRFNLTLCGRAKKNSKTSDLILAGLYRFLAWPSNRGNDAYVLANDEGQASDDLALLKKLIAANPLLSQELTVNLKEILRKDGKGSLRILPARDATGAHGKTFVFCGFDEIHGYRSHDLFEALAMDPTRPDSLTWITSYAGVRHAPGIPLYDLMKIGRSGEDRRMYFSWYSGDFTTDASLVDADAERRANPSLATFGADYLAQQRKRLPAHKFRRLHLNLPGAPDGAAFDGDKVAAAVVTGRRRLTWEPGHQYQAFTDMSGGSSDDAVLAIAHHDIFRNKVVLDEVVSQTGGVPFNPRDAVSKFAAVLKSWGPGITRVTGDRYAGETFRRDFAERGIEYQLSSLTKSEIYDSFEPKLNAGEVELLDYGKLQEQLLTLVVRSGKIDHQPGDHDDWANACCGAIVVASSRPRVEVHFGGIPMRNYGLNRDPQRFY
jgi:hypothetical protein